MAPQFSRVYLHDVSRAAGLAAMIAHTYLRGEGHQGRSFLTELQHVSMGEAVVGTVEVLRRGDHTCVLFDALKP